MGSWCWPDRGDPVAPDFEGTAVRVAVDRVDGCGGVVTDSSTVVTASHCATLGSAVSVLLDGRRLEVSGRDEPVPGLTLVEPIEMLVWDVVTLTLAEAVAAVAPA